MVGFLISLENDVTLISDSCCISLPVCCNRSGTDDFFFKSFDQINVNGCISLFIRLCNSPPQP